MVVIREASRCDYEGISNLITNEDELFLVYPSGSYPFTIDQVKRLSQLRKDLTVLTLEDKVVGFANFYDLEPEKFVFIGNVVIDRSFRGEGLGKKIIMHMLKIAFEKYKLPEVRISVFSDNAPALLLYSRFGFCPYDIEERKNPKGESVALIHMRLAGDGYKI